MKFRYYASWYGFFSLHLNILLNKVLLDICKDLHELDALKEIILIISTENALFLITSAYFKILHKSGACIGTYMLVILGIKKGSKSKPYKFWTFTKVYVFQENTGVNKTGVVRSVRCAGILTIRPFTCGLKC